ncbi:MAG: DUF4912 domain-containing protein [Spirochaetes bacterium]|nr:MAG: DUF4912 domain-containing protein [Spirochaetota bacterium]
MTKERLQSLPTAVLYQIAEKEGFKQNSEELERESLIEYILEAMADSRIEREIINNSAMKLKSSKYDVFQDEELVSREKESFPIPDRYNETKIVLLLRDPQWAFAYWDINDLENDALQSDMFFEGYFLRVYEHASSGFSAENADAYFDIPVSESDNRWYINLVNGGKWYSVGLFTVTHNREKQIAQSNRVKSPKAYIAENKDEILNDPLRKSIILSSLWDYEEEENNPIPQRIIAIMDNNQLDFGNSVIKEQE